MPDEADQPPGDHFRWPPRRATTSTLPPAPAQSSTPLQVRPTSDSHSGPRPEASKALPPAAVQLDAPRSRWGEIERVWLSVTAPPLLDRAAAAGWTPDEPQHYCRRCGASTRPGETAGLGPPAQCAACQEIRVPWDRMIRLGEYESPLDQWVQEVKFTRFRALGEGLGRWLGESIAAEIERARAAGEQNVPPGPPIIVPVPMSFLHRLSRGIDHTTTLARGVRQTTGGTIVRALARSHRPSQLEVLPSERQANVAGAFGGKPAASKSLQGRLVVVVDDVTTTGATLRACVRAIQGIFRRTGGSGGGGGGCPPIWTAVAAWTPEHRRQGPMS